MNSNKNLFRWKVFSVITSILLSASIVVIFVLSVKNNTLKESDLYHEEHAFNDERFITIDSWKGFGKYNSKLVYDKETLVEYYVVSDVYSFGMTPLLNSDGSPILYQPELNSEVLTNDIVHVQPSSDVRTIN